MQVAVSQGWLCICASAFAVELTDSLRQNVTVDWSSRDSVRAKLRLMVKRILRKYKYPPDQQEEAAQLVLMKAETLCEAWM